MKARWPIILLVVIILLFVSFFIASFFAALSELPEFDSTADVAVINLEGQIMSQEQPSLFGGFAALTPDSIKEKIEQAEDANMEAIIFKINSPGGTVLATKEMGDAIKKVEVPTIAVIGDVGASGGYWIASANDIIIADPMSTIGSIGVFGGYLEFSGLMEKYGVGYERLVAGDYKDAGVPYRNLTDEERDLLQVRLDLIHNYFKEEIRANRNMTQEEIDAVSEGMFYLGLQSKDLKLIDMLGDEDTAIEYLKQELNVTNINLVEFEEPPSFFQALTQALSEPFFYVGKGIGQGLVESSQNARVTV